MLEGSAVRTQLVSRHRLRREAVLAEQLAHELDGCAFIPAVLNKDFENIAFMIDRAPQIHPSAGDPDWRDTAPRSDALNGADDERGKATSREGTRPARSQRGG